MGHFHMRFSREGSPITGRIAGIRYTGAGKRSISNQLESWLMDKGINTLPAKGREIREAYHFGTKLA